MDPVEEMKTEMLTNGSAAAAAKIQKYLEEQNNIPLNIAITGESGSGKSTFVNVFRGLTNKAEGAAPTGCVETTIEVTPYPHPNYPNVILWDLPGIGTTNFPADKYLQHVGFERYDFFVIISADRFRENDVRLAKEIQKMGKKFYFVRSKIDHNIRDEERSQTNFNAETLLKQIRDSCINGLQQHGIEAPQVFLVSNVDLHLHDFSSLQKTLDRELPAHKRNVLLLAMPNINLEIINKKKEALHSDIKWYAFTSAFIASAPIPGLSLAVDLAMLVTTIANYQVTFGLDNMSLENLAVSSGTTLDDLKTVVTSPLAATKITNETMIKILSFSTSEASIMAAEEGSRFIPVFGIPVAMALSFTSTYRALNMSLNMLADDAQRVFIKALGLNTSV